MTNFDFLKSDTRFASFAEVAGNAEKILHIDLAASALNCRRALELAVKWMYSVDTDLRMPYQDTLAVLISTREFRDLVDDSLMARIDYIRRIGNQAAHGDRRLDLKKVELCIENLFYFMDFVACCYDRHYQEPHFDPDLLNLTTEEALSFVTEKTVDLQQLMEENQALRDELTASGKPTIQNRSTLPSMKRASYILTPCWRMPAGSRARTGKTRWSLAVCRIIPLSVLPTMCSMATTADRLL